MIERKIIIGLITATDYLKRIQEYWEPMFLESATAKRLASWCWEYFIEYDKAPNKDIEGIFFSKLKGGKLAQDIAEEIEQDILPSLSTEYENEEFNVDYLFDETLKYFQERQLAIHSENIQALIAKGELEEATKQVFDFKLLDGKTVKLDDYILSLGQIRRLKRPAPKIFLKPWLKEGQTTIIYGNYGTGKSLLTILIAYMLGLRDYDNEFAQIGSWQVKRPTGCLYVDGELGELEMEERIRSFEWLGKQQGKYQLRVLSVPEYQLATEDTFYLSNRPNQLKIIKWLKEHPTYKLIVLDSASTLFGLLEENDNSEWNIKINPFLRDLRALGVACLLLHHAGKNDKKGLRGASAMGAMAHNIYKLSPHPNISVDDGEAWFILTKDKQRASGQLFKTFALHFFQNNNKTETHWEKTSLEDSNN